MPVPSVALKIAVGAMHDPRPTLNGDTRHIVTGRL
jgi:hypothetical protein